MTERIAIAGAGMAGAYLYRLLRNRGVEVEIFDRMLSTGCGVKPCAWGTSRDFATLVIAAGLDAERYALRRLPYIFMDEFRVPADLATVDKPRLLKDLLGDARVRCDELSVAEYDRVIDATGTARAFLPPIDGDRLIRCVQRRVHTAKGQEGRIRAGGVGYAWCFPLHEGAYHLGCGTILAEPQERLDELGWVREAGGEVVCGCTSAIRLTGAHGAQPFVTRIGPTQIWGVGEAIGCVAPLAGDGIVPGMRSVALLLDHWDDPAGYTKDILREFRWMRGESRVLDKLLTGRRLSPSDALVLRRNARRMGMEVGIRQAVRLMERIRSGSPASKEPPGPRESAGTAAAEQGSRPESRVS